MKLSFEQIKDISVGAVRVWQETDGTHFAKCTEKQEAAWLTFNEVLCKNSRATTGVRLDFHTNSKSISFGVAGKLKYEIYINNVLTYNLKSTDLSDGYFSFSLNNYEEENRVTIILPSHDDPGVIRFLELDEGSYAKRHEFDTKLLFIGDSITQGWDSGYDSLSYAYRVSRFFNAESVINGVGGGFFHETVFDDIDFEPDAVIIAYGTNDWGRFTSLEELNSQADKFLAKIVERYNGRPIIGISPIWRGDEDQIRATGSFEDVCNTVKKQILEHDMILVDGRSLTPHSPEFFADQFLHPNALGFGIYAENLISQIKKYIEK